MLEKITKLFEAAVPQQVELHMTEANTTHMVTVDTNSTILGSALEAGVEYPHSCRVGSCGRCKCKVLEGEVRNLSDPSNTLTEEEVNEGYILACRAQPKSPLKLEVPAYRRKSRRMTTAAGSPEHVRVGNS